MKKTVLLGLLSTFIFFAFTSGTPECNPTDLKNQAKEKLKPYKYDSAKVTKVTFKKEAQQLEVEVPLFIGENYRFVFNTTALSKKIGISIYTKSVSSKNREMIFSNQAINESETIFAYEPDKKMVRKLFINYDIPENASETEINGCVLFLLGYK